MMPKIAPATGFVLDDSELYEIHFSPTCVYCKHYDAKNHRKCPAFPGGIPDDIWNVEGQHRTPHDGDNGIRFVSWDAE